MVEQFKYRVSGKTDRDAIFDTELLVIASSEAEAEDEAIACIDSFESVSDWSLQPVGRIPADENEVQWFEDRGPFAVFDPGVLHERG